MLQRLPDDYDKPEGQRRTPQQIREELDNELLVSAWKTPLGQGFEIDVHRDPNAPSWWVSDEEASGPWMALAQAQGLE